MSYRDLGEGEPLVLLHAFPLNGRMFETQMKAFSGSYRVVAPDYPGFGRSPRTPAQPDIHYYAEGVRSLREHEALSREDNRPHPRQYPPRTRFRGDAGDPRRDGLPRRPGRSGGPCGAADGTPPRSRHLTERRDPCGERAGHDLG